MENARIAIFDDNNGFRELLRKRLENAGHRVVSEASSVNEALSEVARLTLDQEGVDVTLLDGSLGESHTPAEDARCIAEEVERQGLNTMLVGISGNRLQDYGIPVAADALKDIVRITEVIADL